MWRGLSVYLLRNATAGAYEPPPVLFIYPTCQCRTLRVLRTVLLMTVMFTLCGLRAAVFTEPAITQIEKVGRLVHRPELHERQRRDSGDSVSRTGTDMRLPSRQI
jgi:hypothetical protein